MLFQRLAIYYHFVKQVIEKIKGVKVGQTFLEYSGVYLRFFSTILKKLLSLARISFYF